jgi:hypothetical protein
MEVECTWMSRNRPSPISPPPTFVSSTRSVLADRSTRSLTAVKYQILAQMLRTWLRIANGVGEHHVMNLASNKSPSTSLVVADDINYRTHQDCNAPRTFHQTGPHPVVLEDGIQTLLLVQHLGTSMVLPKHLYLNHSLEISHQRVSSRRKLYDCP